MVAGSFFLTPATAIRYERHDRKVRQLSKEEELGIGKGGRKVDINEEYYRLAAKVSLYRKFGRAVGWGLKEFEGVKKGICGGGWEEGDRGELGDGEGRGERGLEGFG